MQTMHWYNPVTKEEEDIPAPMNDVQAIEMLSGHLDSDRFIEEYRRRRATHPDTIDALILTGETFYQEHRRWQPPDRGQPRASRTRFRSPPHGGMGSVSPCAGGCGTPCLTVLQSRRPSWGILAPLKA
jgi:hypothetical protein